MMFQRSVVLKNSSEKFGKEIMKQKKCTTFVGEINHIRMYQTSSHTAEVYNDWTPKHFENIF